jgi:exonuclease III
MCVYILLSISINVIQTLDQKKEWNVHFEAYIRDLDKKKPVIWTGDLNVAPTEMGITGIVHMEDVAYSLTPQICPMQRETGTKLPDILKQKHPLSRIFLVHPQPRILQSLSTCGASFTLRTDIILISHIDSTAVRKGSAGGWTCVSGVISHMYRSQCATGSRVE